MQNNDKFLSAFQDSQIPYSIRTYLNLILIFDMPTKWAAENGMK